MSHHLTAPLAELKTELLADGIIDADEVALLRERLYDDGIIDREEADFLFEINDAVTGKPNDAGWAALFVEALTDHVLADEVSPGVLDADEAGWLLAKIEGDGQVDDAELALLINITAKASDCDAGFNAFVLAALKAKVLEDGVVDDEEVEMIEAVIYGTGGGAGAGVDRAEADFLLELNDAVSGEANCAGRQALFVEAIAAHVLEDDVSPGVIDDDEAEYLHGQLYADGQIDAVEQALIKHLKGAAKGAVPAKMQFLFGMYA